ncbi:DUF2490 domain-containing protein [uncultured Polaribacter sp.]|uniref:DUF2490 domain-containing protein n=1 Tax=uncultured Polaribacter sp. TaxID=174711 RepID=UPI00259BF0CA|nr:DUF2490 domain-containing protein [uncultured Polaribacter sp.]
MRLLFLIICFFYFNTLFSQNANSELGSWFMYNGSHKISEKWAVKSMAHFRYYELANNFQQEIYRLGANYSFTKKLNVTIGYSYVNTDVFFGSQNSFVTENRMYEDINYTNFLNKLKLRHRFRFEHRFISENSGNSASHWFRYDLNLNYPIADNWSVYGYNEIFLNIDQSKRFVQNWTGFGFLHKLNKNLKINVGYQQIKLPNGIQKRILLGLILNTNHTQKAI